MQDTTNTTYTLDTASLENYFKAVTHTYLEVYAAQTEGEKSQALRDHTAALLQYIDAVDRIVPDSLPISTLPTITQASTTTTTTPTML
ncbi:MAG: hypothetical protein JNN28_12520 [Saprospiraceae bacterium]|nr:hypothetical protein [Saprospiraceae bacterium]